MTISRRPLRQVPVSAVWPSYKMSLVHLKRARRPTHGVIAVHVHAFVDPFVDRRGIAVPRRLHERIRILYMKSHGETDAATNTLYRHITSLDMFCCVARASQILNDGLCDKNALFCFD